VEGVLPDHLCRSLYPCPCVCPLPPPTPLSIVILGLDPRIHTSPAAGAAWMLGSSPSMTEERFGMEEKFWVEEKSGP
jgi:hypothetical protein